MKLIAYVTPFLFFCFPSSSRVVLVRSASSTTSFDQLAFGIHRTWQVPPIALPARSFVNLSGTVTGFDLFHFGFVRGIA